MEETKQNASVTSLNTQAKSSKAAAPEALCLATDLVCLSHLRWDFVYQRPQHLLSRFARHRRVFYVEEPVWTALQTPRLEILRRDDGLHVAVPHIPERFTAAERLAAQRRLLDEMLTTMKVANYTLWYYTPMALEFTRHLAPDRVIYDCMDELSLFRGAPQELIDLEKELLDLADHVFTGGQSIYEAKADKHPSIHPFPSSIDFAHFETARKVSSEPEDQMNIPHSRIGFFGVIDERADIELIEGIARLKPDWQVVLIGPVVKIDPASLPKLPNIHYLGMKTYQELPKYLAGWDVAMLPFAMNESTRFISPTKTPEYLAAGRPVVSTPIRDVIRPYGEMGLVHIASTAEEFVAAAEKAMKEKATDPEWLARVDEFLATTSWDRTWAEMAEFEMDISCMSVTVTSDPAQLVAAVH